MAKKSLARRGPPKFSNIENPPKKIILGLAARARRDDFSILQWNLYGGGGSSPGPPHFGLFLGARARACARVDKFLFNNHFFIRFWMEKWIFFCLFWINFMKKWIFYSIFHLLIDFFTRTRARIRARVEIFIHFSLFFWVFSARAHARRGKNDDWGWLVGFRGIRDPPSSRGVSDDFSVPAFIIGVDFSGEGTFFGVSGIIYEENGPKNRLHGEDPQNSQILRIPLKKSSSLSLRARAEAFFRFYNGIYMDLAHFLVHLLIKLAKMPFLGVWGARPHSGIIYEENGPKNGKKWPFLGPNPPGRVSGPPLKPALFGLFSLFPNSNRAQSYWEGVIFRDFWYNLWGKWVKKSLARRGPKPPKMAIFGHFFWKMAFFSIFA